MTFRPLIIHLLLALSLLAGTASGQLYRFGKNKVQYDEFHWRKMKTPHFDLFFYPEEELLATYAARMAEEGFDELEEKFAHTVQRRIPLIIYSSHVHFEQTNVIPGMLPEGVAGFTEFLKGRVALPLSGSMPDFERVLHHELVHVFMFDRIRTVLRSRGINQFRPSPLWFSEGLAEHWSSELDSYGEMIIRDALFAGLLVPIKTLFRINGSFQLYKEGQSICAFMAAEYGEDVFERLLGNWWRSERFEEIFEITTGESLDELDKAWQYHVRKTFLPDIADADPPSQLAQALTTTGFNLKPEIVLVGNLSDSTMSRSSADLDSLDLLFFRSDQGYTYIARQPLSGGAPAVVVEGERSASYESLHPLGTSLAVTDDGKRLAFSAKQGGRDRLHIWDLERGEEELTLSFDSIVAISSPSWSPEGDRLLFSGAEPGGRTDLYIADVESSSIEALTADIYHDRDPDWDPSGERIVFSSDRWSGGRKGLYNLFLLELGSGRISQLTRGEHHDLQPDWSPTGERIVFTSDRGGMYDLYTAVLTSDSGDGPAITSIHRQSRTLTGLFDPRWLPDERGLVFTGFEAGRFHIYRLDLEEDDVGVDTVAVAAISPEPDEGWELSALEVGALTQRKYKRRLSLDIAQSQISQDPIFGTSGGIQVGLSDLLGNEQYYFVLSHISGSDVGFLNGLNFAFGRMHLARQLNIAWGGFRLNDRFSSRFGRFVREKRTGGFLELSYPFSRHSRVETRMSMQHSDIDRQLEGRPLKGWLASNHISYTHDNSLWIPTGPLEGRRYSFGVGQSVDFKSSKRFNVTLFGDYREYRRLSQRSGFAIRYMGRHSRGDVPEFFSLGGSWTLRGYPWRSIWGSNLILANHELRFPLLDRAVLAFPFGNIDLSAFRGALFVDAGNAWSDEFGDWSGSIGAGTRMAVGGVFVFRLDASRRTDFDSVENSTRWDFFFGWDF